jgi:hypothetical protein
MNWISTSEVPAETSDIHLLVHDFTTRPGDCLLSWFKAKGSDKVSAVLRYLPLPTTGMSLPLIPDLSASFSGTSGTL